MHEPSELSFIVESPQGLHVRPAYQIVQLTNGLRQTHPEISLFINQPTDEIPDSLMEATLGPGPYPTNSILSLLALAAIDSKRFRFILRGPEERIHSLKREVEHAIREIL